MGLYDKYDPERNELIEMSEEQYFQEIVDGRSKKHSEDEEWNRLDDLYDEHYPPGFDPF